MWLFTKYGFFSVVCARKNNGLSSDVDTETLMIRARSKNHLENLINSFQDLNDCQIATTHDTDYRYRIFVPKKTWSNVMLDLSSEIDYGNFKSKVHKSLQDQEFSHCLGDIWSVMYRYQDE
jgi:hypothetical protein